MLKSHDNIGGTPFVSIITYYNLLLRHLLMDKDRDSDSRKLETVLVMQGGGSLGAYERGVYKAFKTW